MAGNGYFAEGKYQAKSTETWADLTNGWDTYTDSWNLTPSTPLRFDTAVVDAGRKDKFIPVTTVEKTGSMTTTVYYGDSLDSAGAIVSESSVSYSTAGDSVSAINARYFRFRFELDYEDSAAVELDLTFTSIDTDLNAEKVIEAFDSIDSSTLGGSLGARELAVAKPITPTVITVQPHTPSSLYVADTYVADDYVSGTGGIPQIYIDKSSDPVVLNIYNLDTFGKQTGMDCVFDAIVQGLPNAVVGPTGNINKG